jgi:hypothetical protein
MDSIREYIFDEYFIIQMEKLSQIIKDPIERMEKIIEMWNNLSVKEKEALTEKILFDIKNM